MRSAGADQLGDAVGEGLGLAANGAGQHQRVPGGVVHRPTLGPVQSGKETHCRMVSRRTGSLPPPSWFGRRQGGLLVRKVCLLAG